MFRPGHKRGAVVANAEQKRLEDAREQGVAWRKWGPYLSASGSGARCARTTATPATPGTTSAHDQARSRAYRWGEDGLAGISDDQQRLCFALALWNGKDPILKERLFGLTNSEGNHGEDVKEYYFYLDSTPTHSYMKYLYKYPQAAYPYDDLVETNRRRSRHEFEYELLDTGRLRRRPLLRRVRRVRQGVARGHPDPDHRPQPRPGAGDAARAADALVPQHLVMGRARRPRPVLPAGAAAAVIAASHPELGERLLYCDGAADAALHRERDQHRAALRRAQPDARTSRTGSTTTSSTAGATR